MGENKAILHSGLASKFRASNTDYRSTFRGTQPFFLANVANPKQMLMNDPD